MENWIPKSESTGYLSGLESVGDSETDIVIGADMFPNAYVSSTNSDDDDDGDDAESTSGDYNCGARDNVQQDIRRQMLCKNWWYDLYDAKQQVADNGEIIDEQRDAVVALVVQPEAVAARDDAESDRLFWDACIAHGY